MSAKCKVYHKSTNFGFLRANGELGARETCGQHKDTGAINLSKRKDVAAARAAMQPGAQPVVVALPPQPTPAVLLAAANLQIADLNQDLVTLQLRVAAKEVSQQVVNQDIVTLQHRLATKEVSLQAETKQVSNMQQQIVQLRKGQQQQPPRQLLAAVVKPLADRRAPQRGLGLLRPLHQAAAADAAVKHAAAKPLRSLPAVEEQRPHALKMADTTHHATTGREIPSGHPAGHVASRLAATRGVAVALERVRALPTLGVALGHGRREHYGKPLHPPSMVHPAWSMPRYNSAEYAVRIDRANATNNE